MPNRYKIDVSKYADISYPYALYMKSASVFARWEFVKSGQTKEELRELHAKLIDLPEPL